MADNKLHTAVRYGNEEETMQALKEGFNPNEIGMLRWSPVHEASHNGERDILKMLLLFKGDVNQKDGLHGNTPLHYAAMEDNSACVTVLLNAGAKLDIQNDQGRTPLDVATSSCLERMEPFINNSQNTAGDDWHPGGSKAPGAKDQAGWKGLDDVPSNAAIGSLHLSFEFHKSTLKVRVWQITDLLLPPPQTSMIESIFVRGYFIPDPAKKSNRKTEDVLVDPTSKNRKDMTRRRPSSPPRGGIQHIFTPSSFRFDTPLLYTGVTDEMVSQRSIQLEVCMTQKNTHKPFLMAMVHMPLRTAVRRPIREKYPLIPCMNYTIPNSMRVYSAKDVFVEGTTEVAPRNVSRSNSLQSTFSNSSLDASSTLQDIRIDGHSHSGGSAKARKLITVNISDSFEEEDERDDSKVKDRDEEEDEEDIDDGIGSSLDVKICSGKGSEASSVTVDVLDTSWNDSEMTQSQGDGLNDVVIHRTGSFGTETSVVVDMDKVGECSESGKLNSTKKKRIIPNELLEKSMDNDDDDVRDENMNNFESENVNSPGDVKVESTVIEVDEPVKETVVDMTRLGRDTVLDIDMMTDSGYDNESVKSESSPVSENKEVTSSATSMKKKRIIPNEINVDNQKDEKEGGGGEEVDFDSGIKVSNKVITDNSNRGDDDYDNDEIGREMDPTRLPSSSSQVSTDKSSTPVTGSRPETPVWDFYDFACNEENSTTDQNPTIDINMTEDSSEVTQSVSNNNKDQVSPSASANASTLQESLARLSRPQPVLDTCHVSGPVLPSITMMEDFEMDEDN